MRWYAVLGDDDGWNDITYEMIHGKKKKKAKYTICMSEIPNV